MNKTPIIIDCDPGVDDSYAIALAKSNPNYQIVALTAVEGNVPATFTRQNCLCLRETFHMEGTKVGFGARILRGRSLHAQRYAGGARRYRFCNGAWV